MMMSVAFRRSDRKLSWYESWEVTLCEIFSPNGRKKKQTVKKGGAARKKQGSPWMLG